MSLQANDIQGQLALKKLAQRERAKAVLAKQSVPGAATLSVLAGAVTAAAASILVKTEAVPKHVAALVVGVLVGLVMLCIEQWSMRRRLDAVIELLNLDVSEAQ